MLPAAVSMVTLTIREFHYGLAATSARCNPPARCQRECHVRAARQGGSKEGGSQGLPETGLRCPRWLGACSGKVSAASAGPGTLPGPSGKNVGM